MGEAGTEQHACSWLAGSGHQRGNATRRSKVSVRVDMTRVVPAADIAGDSAEDTALLKEMLAGAWPRARPSGP